jgi:acetolactate synthase regulatory subunit
MDYFLMRDMFGGCKEFRVPQEDPPVHRVFQVLKDHRGFRVPQVVMVLLDHRAHKEFRVPQEDPKVHRVFRDLKDQLD